MAAITKGQTGDELTEMGALADAGAAGFTDDGRPVAAAGVMRRALQYNAITGRPLALHCEEPTLSRGGHVHAVAGCPRQQRRQDRRIQRDAVAFLASEKRKYDLVLIDPPYGMFSDIEPQLARYLPGVLADTAVVVVETDARVQPALPLPERTSRKYGQTRVTVYG